MVAAEIFDKFSKFQSVNYAGVEDFADRLHFQFTVVLLLSACTTVSFKTYFLSPVACYLPSEIGSRSGQEQFVNNYCWAEGTYSVPLSEFHLDNRMKDPLKPYRNRKIIYYQWVPFLLGLQSMLFYLPRFLWQLLSKLGSGTDIHHLVRSADDAVKADGTKHCKLVTHITRRINMLLNKNKRLASKDRSWKRRMESLWKGCRLLPSRHVGNFLILSYMMVKLLYVANGLGQVALMYYCLGFNKTQGFAFGGKIMANMVRGKDWQSSGLFPRVGSCAIEYKHGAGSSLIFSQCTLPINMINEKIFVFLWFWTLCVTATTLLTIPRWIYRALTTNWRLKYIESFMRSTDRYENVDKRDKMRFIRDYLRLDGIFLLRMIAINAGDVICTEIVCNLWDRYDSDKNGNASDKSTYFKLEVPNKAPSAPLADDEEANEESPDNAATQQLRRRRQIAGGAAAAGSTDSVVKVFPEEKDIAAMDTDATHHV